MSYKVAVIGLGFVGLSLASFFGSKKIKVTGIDYDEKKLKKLKKGIPTFYEPNVENYLKKAIKNGLKFESEITKDTLKNDFIFVTVGTPMDKDGRIDLSYVQDAVKSISENMEDLKNIPSIVIKSTVVPSTATNAIKPILEKGSLKESIDFDLLTNPEFLREGSAMEDTICPHAVVVGGFNKKSANKLLKFYKSIYRKNQKYISTNNTTAELIKYANNAFLATKISFINSIANLCQKIKGTDVDDIAHAIGLDPRISPLFLKAGPGYGGSCFPKDLNALINFSSDIGYNPILLKAVQETNSFQVNAIIDIIKQNFGPIRNMTIGILGLSFKENTDDIRESVSIKLIEYLLGEECRILAHDPMAIENTRKIFGDKINYCKNASDVFDSDCVVLLTPWPEYKNLDENKIQNNKDPLIIDTRRILRIKNPKIRYIALGIG